MNQKIEYIQQIKSKTYQLVDYLNIKFKSKPANVKHYIERLNLVVDDNSKLLLINLNSVYAEINSVIKSLTSYIDCNYYNLINKGIVESISIVKLYEFMFDIATLVSMINKLKEVI